MKEMPAVNGDGVLNSDCLQPSHYQKFFSLLPDLACICSKAGYFRYLNPAWEETLGYTRAELMSRPFLEFVHPDDREQTQQAVDLQISGVNRYRCRDGSYRWLEWRAMPQEGEKEIFAIARDITDRMRAEEELQRKVLQCQEQDRVNEELRKSQELLKAIINGTVDAVFAKDREGRYLLLNESGANSNGRAVDEVLGQTDAVLFAPDDVKRLRDNDQLVMASRSSVTNQETITEVSGREVIYLTTKGPLFDKNGEVYGIFGVARNITELVRAEAALLANQEQLRLLAIELSLVEEKERRRIAAELHDEIGQNLALTKIKLNDLLLACKMSSSCTRSLKEVTELLEMTIQEVRTLTFQISPPLLYEVGFEAAVEWLAEQFEEKHGLQFAIHNESPPMQLDEELSSTLYHVVRELLLNVVKHAAAKKVEIFLRRVGTQVDISIRDDGKGFKVREESGAKGRHGGFGLFNIRQRVQHLGGELRIGTETGTGTTITVTAPLAAA